MLYLYVNATCFKGLYQICLFNLFLSLLLESRERDMKEAKSIKSSLTHNYIVKISGLLTY